MNGQYQTSTPEKRRVITKLVLAESQGYKDQWVRPYEVNATFEDLNKVENSIMKSMEMGNTKVAGSVLTALNPNILTPSAMVGGRADIINGWGEKRFKFTLIIEFSYAGSNSAIINYVQGYTNYLGISMQGTLDPEMVYYTNSVNVLRKTFDANTGQVSVVPIETLNIAKDDNANNQSVLNTNKLARPDDLLAGISRLKDTESDYMVVSDIGSLKDANVVDKTTLLPTTHISKTLESAINNRLTSSAFSENVNIMDSMTADLISPAVENIDFFKLLTVLKGFSTTTFTTNDLKFIDSTLDGSNRIATFMGLGNGRVDLPPVLQSSESADTFNADWETRMAVVIHEGVSAIMGESLLNDISFTITNDTGAITYSPLSEFKSYIEGLNLIAQFEKFMNLFISRVWPTISNNNMSLVKLLVAVQTEADTVINISLDNRPAINYVLPTFANSKTLPIIMDNGKLDVMVENYGQIVDTALEASTHMMKKFASNTFAGHETQYPQYMG